MKTLPGHSLQDSDYAELRKQVDRLVWELVYKPVVNLVRPMLPPELRGELATRAVLAASVEELRNAGDPGEEALRRALQTGACQMVPDHTGRDALFAVAKPDRLISDGLRGIGARLNRQTGLWYMRRTDVPAWVRAESSAYGFRARAAHDQVLRLADDLERNLDAAIDAATFEKGAGHAVTSIGNGWKGDAAVRAGGKSLEASWVLGPAGEQALAEQFARSRAIQIKTPSDRVQAVRAFELATRREVKLWGHEALNRLRDQVDQNAEQGLRSAGLADRIRSEYGVSKGRADLIARQETSNFMSAYRAARAADVGIKEYVWRIVGDARTRRDHRALNNSVQRYDRPPVTDTRSQARNNPGQDFRCRCVDLPRLPR